MRRFTTSSLLPVRGDMKIAVFSMMTSFLAVLLLAAAMQGQLTIDARQPAQARAQHISATRGSSVGRKIALQVSAVASGGWDEEGKVEVDFVLTNIGKEPLGVPVSTHPAGSETAELKPGYTEECLSLHILPRKRPAGILAGGATLYGTTGDAASMVTLSEGESIRVLTRVALPQKAAPADETLVAIASLGKETIIAEGGQLISDLQDIGSAYSREYTLASLLEPAH
jgi:hypothetical protein